MCGLFGFAAQSDRYSVDLDYLERIAEDTESRGPHSFGLAWLDSRNRLRMYKQTGRISRSLDVLQMVADAKLLIGHCRFATHGEITPINAHPHASDGGWIVHNGQIFDYEEINDRFNLSPISDCDSETIGLLIESLDGSLIERVQKTIREVANRQFAMMGLWKSPNKMVIARTGNPLHASNEPSGVYFASRPDALKKPKSLRPDELRSYSFRGGFLQESSRQLRRSCLI